MVTRAEIAAAARTYIGAPYRHQGRLASGIDCVGLVVAVARDLGLLPEGFADPVYGRRPDGRMIPLLDEHLARTRVILTGTVVVFADRDLERHVGVMVDAERGRFVHASARRAKVVETVRDANWQSRRQHLALAYDFPRVTD